MGELTTKCILLRKITFFVLMLELAVLKTLTHTYNTGNDCVTYVTVLDIQCLRRSFDKH